MGTAGCAQQTSAAYSPLRRRGAYYPLFRSAGIHLLIKMLRVYQLRQDYCFIKHPVTVSERAPRGGRGAPPRRPASAAVRGAARAALRRYDCPDPAIDICGSRAGERRASPVDRRTSLSHELQRPCGPKRQSLSHETPRTCQYWQYKASPSRRRDVRSSYTAPRAYADPPAR